MQAWLQSIAGPEYASALMWTVFALIGLLVLLVVIRIVRGLTFGTFVAGGRNRKARLAVMDATAVDSHRRLVLVRRDDVEHLILIGGPSDVVVEQNIRLLPPARRPAEDSAGHHQVRPVAERQPHAEAPPRPPQPQPAAAPQPVRDLPPQTAPAAPAAAPIQPVRPAPAYTPPVAQPQPSYRLSQAASSPAAVPRPAAAPREQNAVDPVRAPASATASPAASSYTSAAPSPKPDPDAALMKELEVSLDKDQARPAPRAADTSLDDEMRKLLGDLSAKR